MASTLPNLPPSLPAPLLDLITDGLYVLDPTRKITYWNKAAERITGFSAAEVVGRSCRDNILTHVDGCGLCLCKDTCPAADSFKDGQPRSALVYLHHKEGHRLAVRIQTLPLRDESGNVTAVAEVFTEESVRGARVALETLKKLSMNDLQTSLPNRRYLESRIDSRLEEMRRFGWSFGIFMAEIDHYGELEQAPGPDLSVQIIKMVGVSIASATRALDTVGRWDTYQFLGVIANSSAEELQVVAERARALVESAYLNLPTGTYRATVSIGASPVERADTAQALLRRAEVCLYHSRSAGRNRITLHSSSPRREASSD